MRYAATHDVLTNVMNRAGIENMLRREMSRARREKVPISVVLVDVDHFKAINDELGHDAGDAVLRELPRRVLNQLRAYDGVGRYGGEEFLLVLPGCQLLDCVARAEKIRAAVAEQPSTVPDGLRPVTISMGAAVALPGVENAQDELLKQADVALYEAKHNGRNQVRAYGAAESVVLQSRESE